METSSLVEGIIASVHPKLTFLVLLYFWPVLPNELFTLNLTSLGETISTLMYSIFPTGYFGVDSWFKQSVKAYISHLFISSVNYR